MFVRMRSVSCLIALWAGPALAALPIGTAFTYQGLLEDGGGPVTNNSPGCDFEFTLWDDPTAGSQIGSTSSQNGVSVDGGVFTVPLDFGAGAINGQARWLEISVCCPSPGCSLEMLSPRVELTPAPQAFRAIEGAGPPNAIEIDQASGKVAVGSTPDLSAGSVFQVYGGARVTDFIQSFGVINSGGTITVGGTAGVDGVMFPDGTLQTTAGGGGGGDGHSLDAVDGDPIDALFVDADGEVGIGTSDPRTKLQVVGAGAVGVTIVNTTEAVGEFADLAFQKALSPSSTNTTAIIRAQIEDADPNPLKSSLRFRVNQGDSSLEAVTIRETGDMGIGTDAPAEKLDVSGNAHASGTIASGNSITIDGSAGSEKISSSADLELHVADGRALRIETNATSPNLIGGLDINTVTSGVVGATIGGGGSDDTFAPNRVSDSWGTVGGGVANRAGDDAGTTDGAQYATVGGGAGNTASSASSTVAGGVYNTSTGTFSTVGGGFLNTASGGAATVPGGYSNEAGGDFSFTAGFEAKVRDATTVGDSDGDEGTFVWCDSGGNTGDRCTSTGPNQFIIQADGGVGIGTSSPLYPLHVETSSLRAIYGVNTATSGLRYGLYGESHSDGGAGVFGHATGTTGPTYGLQGRSDSSIGRGVHGYAASATGTNYGLLAETNSPDGYAGYFTGPVGSANYFRRDVGIGTASPDYPLHVETSSAARAIYGEATQTSGTAYGVYGQSSSTGGGGVYGEATQASGSTYGVYGVSSSSSGKGVLGYATRTTGSTIGVAGWNNSTDGTGVFGYAYANSGVTHGVHGGIDSPDGYAGYFEGPDGSANYFEQKVGIGTAAPEADLHVADEGSAASIYIDTYNSAVSGAFLRTHHARGTMASPTALLNGDALGEVSFGGHDGSAMDDVSAKIISNATQNWAVDAHGASLAFHTTPNGSATASQRMIIDEDGNVGIRRNPTANDLEVEGTASKTTSGSWLANSDRRIKQDIQTVKGALDRLDAVRLVSFDYTDEYRSEHPSIKDRRYLNVIAQEFAQIFPDDVTSSGEKLPGSDEEVLQVDIHPLTIYSAAALQELHQIVKNQKEEIGELRSRIDALEQSATGSIAKAGLPFLLVGLVGLAALRRRNGKEGV